MDISTSLKPILFFDGVCNLCNASVQFVIKHDKQQLFLFSPLQSAIGMETLKNVPAADKKAGSVILYYEGTYYTRSAAILKTFRLLGGWFNILTAGYILPTFIRDGIYNYVASNRLKWYGQKTECMVPSPELQARFIA